MNTSCQMQGATGMIFLLEFPMSEDAVGFREQAEKCRRLAAQAIEQIDGRALLRIADEWLRLAEAAERRTPSIVPAGEHQSVYLVVDDLATSAAVGAPTSRPSSPTC